VAKSWEDVGEASDAEDEEDAHVVPQSAPSLEAESSGKLHTDDKGRFIAG
jgi:hypothetical protein